MEKLQQLLDDGIIDEVYNQLKTGKEAEVWLVSHRGEAVAAKLYKEREFRNFKNDAGYREGRSVRNSRTQRAIDKGTKFGREAAEEAWKSAEADAMETLHKLGVHVPKPVMFYDGVLLMEVIGDAEGRVAPRLVEAAISREQASAFYERLRGDVVKMLAADLIHGDLSEFNILLGANGPVIIDFPQIVTAAKNSQSEQYFRRDLGNLLRFFSGIDPALSQKHAGDADDIWRAYVRRHLSPHFVPGGRAQHGDRGAYQRHDRNPRRDNAAGAQNGQRREFTPNNGGAQNGQRREFTPNNGGAQNGQRREFTPNNGGAQNGQRREFTPNNGGAQNGQRREFTPNNGGGQNGPRREFTPNTGGAQNGPRREFTPNNGVAQNGPRREFTPNNGGAQNGQRREFTPNNGGGQNGPRREFTPNNGVQNGQRREFTPNNGGAQNGQRREFTPGGDQRGPRGDGAQRNGGASQPRSDGQRRGPDVSVRGNGGAPSFDARDNRSGGHRRRPKRHF